MVLNKYLAHAGICSRRNAATLIKDGLVKVNGIVTTDPSYRVADNDSILVREKPITAEQKVYVVLNKPNDYITTVSDEKGRRTVIELVKEAGPQRLYPVGRLDRN